MENPQVQAQERAMRFHNGKAAELCNPGIKISETLKREAIEAKEILGELSLPEAARHIL